MPTKTDFLIGILVTTALSTATASISGESKQTEGTNTEDDGPAFFGVKNSKFVSSNKHERASITFDIDENLRNAVLAVRTRKKKASPAKFADDVEVTLTVHGKRHLMRQMAHEFYNTEFAISYFQIGTYDIDDDGVPEILTGTRVQNSTVMSSVAVFRYDRKVLNKTKDMAKAWKTIGEFADGITFAIVDRNVISLNTFSGWDWSTYRVAMTWNGKEFIEGEAVREEFGDRSDGGGEPDK